MLCKVGAADETVTAFSIRVSRVGHLDQETRDGPSLRRLVVRRNAGEHAVRSKLDFSER